jgi:histidine triad (HIT) family protein
MPDNCIFCRIVKGEIPSTRVYEDKHFMAFMDINPVVKGHALVIPKTHSVDIVETAPEVLAGLIVAVRLVAQAQVKGLKADGINVAQANGALAGQVVPHIHFHLVPRFKNDRHSWHDPAGKYESSNEMMEYADLIRNSIGNSSHA